MEIRDPLHGQIKIEEEEIKIIRHPFFQRLRRVRQLGLSEIAFPGATHTRYLHSLGVLFIAERAFETIFSSTSQKVRANSELLRLRETLRLACLVHDIGHPPLSHSTEVAMPKRSLLGAPFNLEKEDSRATHEDYSIKILLDSSFRSSFKDVEKKFGINVQAIADLIRGKTKDPDYFRFSGLDYFPILHQLVSSELDCDRMDYLQRDSYFCGVNYGKFDYRWIVENLISCEDGGKVFLGLNENSIWSFENFLLARHHMHLLIYFHHKSVCLEKLLHKFLNEKSDIYQIPSNIEEYLKHDDFYLMNILREDDSDLAKRILNGETIPKFYETYKEDDQRLREILAYFHHQKEKTDYLYCSSKSYLTKKKGNNSFFIRVNGAFGKADRKDYHELDEYSEVCKHLKSGQVLERIYLDPKKLSATDEKVIYDIMGSI